MYRVLVRPVFLTYKLHVRMTPVSPSPVRPSRTAFDVELRNALLNGLWLAERARSMAEPELRRRASLVLSLLSLRSSPSSVPSASLASMIFVTTEACPSADANDKAVRPCSELSASAFMLRSLPSPLFLLRGNARPL
eukprot:scaffold23767_cov62-Phaeocystis_antarctica.AAC.7